jgi:hypothetical protein
MLDKQQIVSAQVILRPAHGKSVSSDAPITAETLPAYLPSEEATRLVKQYFAQAGFQLGPLVGNNFSITVPLTTFENIFRVQIRCREQGEGGFEVVQDGGSGTDEFPLQALPPAIRQYLETVTFVPPYTIDF